MVKPHIKVYIDSVSPFGYLGYWFIRHSPTFKSCDVEYVPILLGGLMKACGNTAPLFIKNKDKWINRERLTWASLFNIPLRPDVPQGKYHETRWHAGQIRPGCFPVPTVNAQRLLTAVCQKSPAHLTSAIDALYAAVWCPASLPENTAKPNSGSEYNINSAPDLLALLSPEGVLGKDLAEEMVRAMSTPETKAQLVTNTNTAFEDGAFGLPWFQCTNAKGETQGFWGFDHLGVVCRFMELELQPVEGGQAGIRAVL